MTTTIDQKGLYAVFMTAHEIFHGPASTGQNIQWAQICARQMVREVLLPARARDENERWDEGEEENARLISEIDSVEYRWCYSVGGAGDHLVCAACGATLRIYL